MIINALKMMEVTTTSGWPVPEKLKATDRQAIELEIEQYAIETGHAKLTAEKAKDWCNVCHVFIEALGRLTPVMQHGALVNMFREMVDHDRDHDTVGDSDTLRACES